MSRRRFSDPPASRSPQPRQGGRRHELDLADRNQTIRREGQPAGMRVSRCAGIGRRVGAKQASLTIMVGGTVATFAKVKPLFCLMGMSVTLVGGNDDGQ